MLRQTSLEATVAAREDALMDVIESREQMVKRHSIKCQSLKDQVALLGADKVRLGMLTKLTTDMPSGSCVAATEGLPERD